MTRTTEARSGLTKTKLVLLAMVVALIAVAIVSYTWFVEPATETVESVAPADAVVVFVGSEERVDRAVELMERGAAPNLVIPNGHEADMDDDLCDDAPFPVFCPPTETIDTRGEAQTIGRLAGEQGWSSLIAVTSDYHVHRATYQLSLCHDGPIQAVASDRRMDRDDIVEAVLSEWAGTLAAMTIQRAC